MSFFGVTGYDPNERLIYCIAHNLTHAEAKLVAAQLKEDGIRCALYTHAIFHDGKASTCEGCRAAVEETIAMGEEAREDERRRGTPTSKITQSTSAAWPVEREEQDTVQGGESSPISGGTKSS